MSKRKPNRKRPYAQDGGVSPDEMRFKGRDVEVVDLPGFGRRVKSVHSVLDQLHKLGPQRGVSSRQYFAGDRFRDDYFSCGHTPRSIDYSEEHVDGGAHKPMPEGRLDAMQRFGGAIVALGGEGNPMAQVALHVCVHDSTVKDFARSRQHHEKSGLPMLREALNLLAKHYGY